MLAWHTSKRILGSQWSLLFCPFHCLQHWYKICRNPSCHSATCPGSNDVRRAALHRTWLLCWNTALLIKPEWMGKGEGAIIPSLSCVQKQNQIWSLKCSAESWRRCLRKFQENAGKWQQSPFMGQRIISQLRGRAKRWAVEVFGKTACSANTKSSFWAMLVAFFCPQMISNFRSQILTFRSFLWGQVERPCLVLHSTNKPENVYPGNIFHPFEE